MSASVDALGKLGTPEATDEISFSDEPIDRMALIGANIDFFSEMSSWRCLPPRRIGRCPRVLGSA